MLVPSLHKLLRGLVAELVMQEGSPCLATDLAASHLLLSLDQGAWGAESKAVLDTVVQRYPNRVTPRVVLALLPSSTTALTLRECPLITAGCINQIINRCPNLQSLDLAGNAELNFSGIDLFQENGGLVHQSLSHVSLEDCHVSNHTIQALLKNAPMLQSLNIARCHITDAVFLLNETKQLAREGGFQHPSLNAGYDSQLQSVDVTGCSEFSSTGLRHLCTLCGPSLRVLNMSWTKVDSTSLVYLSGLGLPAVVQFYLSLEKELPEARLSGKQRKSKTAEARCKALLETLTQFEQISAQLRVETQTQVNNGNKQLQTPDSHDIVSDQQSLPGASCFNPFCSSLSSEINKGGSPDSMLNNVESALDDSGHPLSPQMQEDESSEDTDKLGCSNLIDSCSEDTKNEDFCPNHSTTQSVHKLTSPLQKQSSTAEHIDTNGSSQKESYGSASLPGVSWTQTKYSTDSANTLRTVPFFIPNIKELCISGTVFSDAPASHRCLRHFLESNPGLATLRLMGGLDGQSVNDEVLGLVTETSRALKHMSLEGCIHLTTAAVAGLAACTQLKHLDLTGVAFVEDAGLVYLVRKLALTSLLIAETRVKNKGLIILASQPSSNKLEELELSWCEDLEDDDGLNAVASNCTGLRRLILRECAISSTTLELIATSCHNLTELSLACCDMSKRG
ncbi:F-box/LRR-repeat protein 2-like [Elysia marginata]|uniref:F-box/LRR-repeat protein 2-like n=1 Tax=Elysia marginata TaxID=1093978 RepID=A0AAV4JIF3_9GAST|nr:F-box/LRR-repeat protein 2-like [Elysia marginata]